MILLGHCLAFLMDILSLSSDELVGVRNYVRALFSQRLSSVTRA